MTYKQLVFFFPHRNFIPIILDYLSKTKEQILHEKIHIEIHKKNIISDISFSKFIHSIGHGNKISHRKVSLINKDINYIKRYYKIHINRITKKVEMIRRGI